MSIPRRIIQVHRSPDIQRELRETWIAQNPGYEYLFFTNDQARDFVAQHRPGLLPIYDKLPGIVQKVDLFRYLVVHEIGGLYADVDTICCAPLDSYVDMERDHLVGGMEMTLHHYRHGTATYMENYATPYQVCNWTFAAPKGHLALALCMQRIEYYVNQMSVEQLVEWSKADRFTLELTGPAMWTYILNEFLAGTRQGAVTILPRLTWGSLPHEQRVASNAEAIKVKHLFEGFWKNRSPARNYVVRI